MTTLITRLDDERLRNADSEAMNVLRDSLRIALPRAEEAEARLCAAQQELYRLQGIEEDADTEKLAEALHGSTSCPHEEEVKRLVQINKVYEEQIAESAAVYAERDRLQGAVEKASCGPRIDPSRCSGCNGAGIGNCICGGAGTVEAERDGYKVATLNRLLKKADVKEVPNDR